MDAIVLQALKKWPNVPDCFAWLGLDARGQWWMRDARAQAAGPFLTNQASKGACLQHANLRDFIGRNYLANEQGAWFFQNGPQRVWVELELSPLIWRTEDNGGIRSHTGQSSEVLHCVLDEMGRLYAASPIGLGVVHSQDMHQAADFLLSGRWPEPIEKHTQELPACYGFVRSPAGQY